MNPTKPELLHGPYTPPLLQRGDRTACLYRDAEVVISSWSDAPFGARGGAGLLVTEELVRAIRTESSLAIQYWWGVHGTTVCRWRKTFGVTRWGTEGSRRLRTRPKAFCEMVADTRNYYTHYTEKLREKASTGMDLSLLVHRLRILLMVVLFKELGIGEAAIRQQISNHPWLMQMLRFYIQPDV